MRSSYLRIISWSLLLISLILIRIIRDSPSAGEYYARHIYPGIAGLLSSFSSLFPFSLGDCFLIGCILGIFIYLIRTVKKKGQRVQRLTNLLLFLGWIYVWFYAAWGLNYFRQDFYTRTGIPHQKYSPESFRIFLDAYTKELNASYVPSKHRTAPDSAIRQGYRSIAGEFGLISPESTLKAKSMLFSSWMSAVGVTGYMGPFFIEFNLNDELRPEEYPAVYAHEMAHRLSISGEAEANFYAWLVCTRSQEPAVRYSGNFFLLGYVLNNASRLLSEEEFQTFVKKIRPEIREAFKANQLYWQNKYHPYWGKVQHKIYNFFLKSNRIGSGTKNYSEVIGLIISYQKHSERQTTAFPPGRPSAKIRSSFTEETGQA